MGADIPTHIRRLNTLRKRVAKLEDRCRFLRKKWHHQLDRSRKLSNLLCFDRIVLKEFREYRATQPEHIEKLRDYTRRMQREHIYRALSRNPKTSWGVRKTADDLGVSVATLYRAFRIKGWRNEPKMAVEIYRPRLEQMPKEATKLKGLLKFFNVQVKTPDKEVLLAASRECYWRMVKALYRDGTMSTELSKLNESWNRLKRLLSR